MMCKKVLTVLLFILITSPVFSAGSSGGSSGGGEAKPVSQYQIGEKMIIKQKNLKKKIKQIKHKNITKKLLDIC